MNERIVELALQAGLLYMKNGKPYPAAMSSEECRAAYAKFAELIVRECCDQVRMVDAMEIKEHFGIKQKVKNL